MADKRKPLKLAMGGGDKEMSPFNVSKGKSLLMCMYQIKESMVTVFCTTQKLNEYTEHLPV